MFDFYEAFEKLNGIDVDTRLNTLEADAIQEVVNLVTTGELGKLTCLQIRQEANGEISAWAQVDKEPEIVIADAEWSNDVSDSDLDYYTGIAWDRVSKLLSDNVKVPQDFGDYRLVATELESAEEAGFDAYAKTTERIPADPDVGIKYEAEEHTGSLSIKMNVKILLYFRKK